MHETDSDETACGRLAAGWVDAVCRRAARVLAVVLLLTIAAGWYAAAHLGMNTDTSGMLAEDLPFQRANAEMARAFPSQQHLILVVVEAATADQTADAASRLAEALRARDSIAAVTYPPDDPFFRRNGLLLLPYDELAEMVDSVSRSQAMLARLAADPSLRGLTATITLALDNIAETSEGERVRLAEALGRMAEVAERRAGGEAASLAWRELMQGHDARPEDRRQLIVVQPRVDFSSLQPAGRAMAAIRDTAAGLGLGSVRVRLTGSAAMSAEELSSIEVGMGWIGGASASLVALLLWWCFGSTRLALYTFAAMAVGLVWTFAFAAAAVGHLNVLSVAVAVLFVGLSVDFGIHFGVRYREQIGLGSPPDRALRLTAGHQGGALGLAALAAAIGFLSFLPTDYVGLSELGLIAGAGMVAALAANLTLLPALLTLAPADGGRGGGGGLMPLIQAGVPRHARKVALAALLLAVATASLLPSLRFDFDLMSLRDPDSESVSTFHDIAADRRVTPYTAAILAPDLAAADQLAQRLRRHAEVAAATTLSSMVPDDQVDKMILIEQAVQFLLPVFTATPLPPPTPGEREAAVVELRRALEAVGDAGLRAPAHRLAEALAAGVPAAVLETALLGGLPARLAELTDALAAQPFADDALPAVLRDGLLAADGRALVRVYPKEDPGDPAALARFVAAVQQEAPAAGGSAVTMVEAGDAVVAAFQQATLTALLAISLLLLAVLRSVRDTLLVLTPLALAGLMLAAASVLLGQPFNFANVIVLPLLLGLGISSGLYIVLRHREMRDAESAAVLSTATPRGVTFSALTTVVSFGTLTFSSHPGTASMGLMLTLALSFALVCTIVLLPALLHLVAPPARAKTPAAV